MYICSDGCIFVCMYIFLHAYTYIHMYIFAHLHFTAELEIMNTKKNVDDDRKALS